MKDNMSLLIITQTRNVVGAMTLRAGAAKQAVGAAGVLVRSSRAAPTSAANEREQFEISAGELEATDVTDLEPTVFLQPLEYAADDKGRPVRLTVAVSNVVLTSDEVTVTVPALVPDKAKVWVQISADGLPSPRVANGELLKAQTECKIGLEPIGKGAYSLVAFVEGHSVFTDKATIP